MGRAAVARALTVLGDRVADLHTAFNGRRKDEGEGVTASQAVKVLLDLQVPIELARERFAHVGSARVGFGEFVRVYAEVAGV